MKRIEGLTRDDILARKKEGRRELARLSFGRKVLIVERMREELAPFCAMRTKRRENAAVAVRQTARPVADCQFAAVISEFGASTD